MKRRILMRRILFATLICAAALLGLANLAHAQGLLDIPWWTADGGGGLSQGGDYILHGTAGQPDAGAMQGGNYILSGGFWSASSIVETLEQIFLPVVVK